jgi:hypothetical protein
LVPFARSVPRHNPVSERYRQFLQPHGFHLPQLDFQVVETSRMSNGNKMHLNFESHSKGFEYLCK